MSNSDAQPTLRQRAEQILQQRADAMQHSPEEANRLLHELHVHQIELELQNEALRDSQAALEASRMRYFTLYDLAPVGYVTLSEQGLIQEANLTAASLLHIPRSQLLMQPLTFFIVPADQDLYYQHQRRLATTGTLQTVEVRMHRADQSMFWAHLESSIAHDPLEGDNTTYRTVISDVTARMEAELALRELNATLEQHIADQTSILREREERMRALVDASTQIVWTSDSTGAVVEDSPSWRRFTGQSLEAYRGWGWLDAVHPADRDVAQRQWQAALAQTIPLDNTFRLRHVGGEWRWMWVRAVPLRSDTGTIRGWVGMSSDITVRKLAEQQLADNETAFRALAHRLLEVQEIERRTLAAELHDELGQLLTGLNLLLLAINPHADPAAVANRLTQAQQNVGELIQRVRQISLDLRPPMLDDLGLHTTLEWFLARYREQTQISVDFTSEVAATRFPNLIELAAYRVAQEALTNVARHAAATQVMVRLWSDAGALCLQIADNGCGFHLAELKPYASNGIAGMRERVMLLGGAFNMDSAPGKGAQITVRLPLPSNTDAQEHAQ